MTSSTAEFAAAKPNRCHGVRSTKLASSMTEKRWIWSAADATGRIFDVPLLAAREASARLKAEAKRWLESPSGEAMLLRTHRICCASVTSLDSMAFAQWTSNCSMQVVSPNEDEVKFVLFEEGNIGQGLVLGIIWLLLLLLLWLVLFLFMVKGVVVGSEIW